MAGNRTPSRIIGNGRSALGEKQDLTLSPQAADSAVYGKTANFGNADSQRGLSSAKFAVSDTGVVVAESATMQDIINKMREVSDVQRADFWLIGDLCVFVEDKKWSSIYNDIAAITGKSVKTLQNYAWIARAVHNSLRGEKGMTAKHYKLIAPLKLGEQQRLIKRVQEKNWSAAQLDAAIKGDLIPPTPSRLSDLGDSKVYVQSAKKLAQYASGVGESDADEIRADIATMRRWLDDLEKRI